MTHCDVIGIDVVPVLALQKNSSVVSYKDIKHTAYLWNAAPHCQLYLRINVIHRTKLSGMLLLLTWTHGLDDWAEPVHRN